MSGHSKWANIKRKKESADAKRANIFSKIGKEIAVAVKIGGSADPSINSKLRDVVAKAKANNMPNDNINRCIQKAAGEGSGENYEEIVYEGFGPAGTAVIVEVTTDNRNRAAADVSCIFDRAGGNMGQTGCVSYMFDKKGVIIIERTDEIDEYTLMMEVLENGADDFVAEDEYYEISTAPDDFRAVRDALEQKGYTFAQAELEMIPQNTIQLTDEHDILMMEKLIEHLEDNDDVQNIYHNWEEAE